jgi:hypothetical protein
MLQHSRFSIPFFPAAAASIFYRTPFPAGLSELSCCLWPSAASPTLLLLPLTHLASGEPNPPRAQAPTAGVFLPSLRSGVESRHAPLRVASSGSIGRAGKSFQTVRMMTAAAPSSEKKAAIVGPAWDNTPEYPSMGSAEFKADMDRVEALSKECGAMAAGLNLEDLESIDVQVLIEVSKKMDEAVILLSNCATYVSCEQSTDGGNEEARSIMAKIRSISSTLTQQVQPVSLALKLISDDKVNQFLAAMPSERFAVMHSRKQKDFTLSLAEENLVTALSVDGLNAWNQMHSAISVKKP